MKATVAAASAAALCLAACGGSNGGNNSTQGVGNVASGDVTKSNNWSGYVVTGLLGGFNQVSGSWTVPAVSCGSSATSSATWAGIGGFEVTDQTLIQAGTEQDCDNGSASYYAWWEGYPAASVDITTSSSYPVSPGDQITVTIDSSLLLFWTIKIEDQSAGWTFTKTTAFVATGQSAEWIMEAPLVLGNGSAGESTLSNFGSVSFSGLNADSKNPGLSDSNAIVMVNASGAILAQPSAPGSGGDSFDVCYGGGGCN
jgi:hypothetical protein